MSGPIIGGLNERSLHRQLKEHYSSEGSLVEEKVDGYVIDIVNPEGLIEIQTGNFSGMKKKLRSLLPDHSIRLVYPVAAETLISVYSEDGMLKSQRRSPKRGSVYSCASELLYIADLLSEPKLTVETVLIRQEEIRLDDGKGAWRRHGVSIEDRQLDEIIETITFNGLTDYLKLLPMELPPTFGNREVADKLPSTGTGAKGKLRLAGQITWLLRKTGLIEEAGMDGRRLLFELSVQA